MQSSGIILKRHCDKNIHYLLLKTNRLKMYVLVRLDFKANLFWKIKIWSAFDIFMLHKLFEPNDFCKTELIELTLSQSLPLTWKVTVGQIRSHCIRKVSTKNHGCCIFVTQWETVFTSSHWGNSSLFMFAGDSQMQENTILKKKI